MSSVLPHNKDQPTKKKNTAIDPVETYGFTAVPSSAETLLNSSTPYPAPSSPPAPISVSDIPIPNTPLAQRIHDYAKSHLPEPTYNHSLRVYLYGIAMKRYRFPTWAFTDETYFLSCLLHDIGTTEENLRKTHISFEFYGGILALNLLQSTGAIAVASPMAAPREQAESVTEAIIRHQDLCQEGKITALGQLLQLATIFGTFFLLSLTPFPPMAPLSLSCHGSYRRLLRTIDIAHVWILCGYDHAQNSTT